MMFLLVALDLCCFVRGFSSCSELGLLFIVVLGLLIVVVSLLWSTGFSRLDPVVAPCGIFLEQGIKLVSTTLSGGFLAIASPGKPQAIKLRNGIGFLGLILFYLFISSVQFCRSVVSDSLQPHGLQHARPLLSKTNTRNLLKLMSIESVMPSNHLILSSPSPSAFKFSQHQDLFQ